MWNSFWGSVKTIFIFQKNTWTVLYAKNPISTYAGQSVKVNSKKNKLEFLKRFAIPHAWSITYDMETGEEHRFYKKGKKIMQIPIQSLNS